MFCVWIILANTVDHFFFNMNDHKKFEIMHLSLSNRFVLTSERLSLCAGDTALWLCSVATLPWQSLTNKAIL